MIKLGNLNISSIYYGGKEISSVYYGSTLVYSTTTDYEYVDLGLPSGKLWMKCNLGAKKETESGLYYAWGNLNGSTKDGLWDGSTGSSTNGIMNIECDAVYSETKGVAHIPTRSDIEELQENTDSEWILNYNNSGVNGRLFTSKNNQNTIFIPASGLITPLGFELYNTRLNIWTSSTEEDYADFHLCLNSSSSGMWLNTDDGYFNCNLRGVKYSYNGHEFVDLGLPSGTKWATMNVGANSPTEYGKYFAWGETVGYYDNEEHDFGWNTYKYGVDLTKYNATDGKTTLDLEDDAVHVNMGGDWHIPTLAQIEELLNETNNRWVANYQGSGVHGMLFTSKTDSTKIIFIPNSGFRSGTSVSNRGDYADLWSSSLVTDHPDFSCNLFFDSEDYFAGQGYRCYGYCVRGVIG